MADLDHSVESRYFIQYSFGGFVNTVGKCVVLDNIGNLINVNLTFNLKSPLFKFLRKINIIIITFVFCKTLMS